MSAFILANFLQKEAKTNKKLSEALDRCVKLLEEHESLQKENVALEAECFRLDMEGFTMDNQIAKMQEVDKVRENEFEMAKSVLSDIVDTRLQFEEMNLDNLAQYKLDYFHMKMKQEYEALKKSANERENVYKQMENRPIVIKLRAKQKEVLELQEEIKSMSNTFKLDKKSWQQQINNTLDERNALIVEFVKCVKNIQRMQAEFMGAADSSRETYLTKTAQAKCLEESLNFSELEQISSVRRPDFVQELLQSKRQNTNASALRSILRKEPVKGTPPKKVLIIAPDDSSVSSAEDEPMTAVVSTTISCRTESENIIEDDEKIEENYFYPAQSTGKTIDLVTPTAKDTNAQEEEVPEEIENGNYVEIQENFMSSDFFSDLSLAEIFNNSFSQSGIAQDNADTTKAAVDMDNKNAIESFMEFNLEMDMDDKETDAIDLFGDDFSKFFD